MSARSRIAWDVVAFVVFVTAVFVPKIFWPDAWMYRAIFTAPVLSATASVLKLASLGSGCVYAVRVAARFERGNPSRSAWSLLGLWLGGFALGQLVLSTYELLFHSVPLPSAADVFFLLAYVGMISAAVRFVVVYRASGLPVGSAREALAIAGGATLVFAVLGYRILAPIATADAPLLERLVNVAYPVLDFVSLVPTLLLLRITSRFRGGRVWSVWASLLIGFAFAAPGDILFAYMTSIGEPALDPLLDPIFALSYFFLARGAVLQHRLLSD